MTFLEFADSRRILVMILPPHSTHRLQPLDISLFSPLATAYSNELNQLMHKSLGMVSMSKGMFWPMFRAAWRRASRWAILLQHSQNPASFHSTRILCHLLYGFLRRLLQRTSLLFSKLR